MKKIFIVTLLSYLITSPTIAGKIDTTGDYFHIEKQKADQVIKECGYNKDEVYALYVASLDSVNRINGDLRQEFNTAFNNFGKLSNKDSCDSINAKASYITREYKISLSMNH